MRIALAANEHAVGSGACTVQQRSLSQTTTLPPTARVKLLKQDITIDVQIAKSKTTISNNDTIIADRIVCLFNRAYCRHHNCPDDGICSDYLSLFCCFISITNRVSVFLDFSVSKYVNAMVHPKSSKDEYEDLAHSLFGILDAVKQEMPDVIRSLPKPRPKTITAQADVSLCHKPTEKYSMEMINHIRRITAGSVSRKDAAMKFRFLADEYSRLSTQKAIGELSSTEKNVYAKIRPDGTIHSEMDLDRKYEELDDKGKIDHNEFLFIQIIDMIHGQFLYQTDFNATTKNASNICTCLSVTFSP